MGRMQINSDLAALQRALAKCSVDSQEIFQKALYQGAKVEGDALKSKLKACPTVPDDTWGTPRKRYRGLRVTEKAGLLAQFGISEHKFENKRISAYIGVSNRMVRGNYKRSPQWHVGVPANILASQLNRGTTWQTRYPWLRPVVTSTKSRVEKTIESKLKLELKMRVRGN